jgi:hypothetical protein
VQRCTKDTAFGTRERIGQGTFNMHYIMYSALATRIWGLLQVTLDSNVHRGVQATIETENN